MQMTKARLAFALHLIDQKPGLNTLDRSTNP